MAKKLHTVIVRGHQHEWSFETYVDPRYIEEWRADGLEINEIYNSIPAWIVDVGLERPFCFLQDLWNMKNPFKNKERFDSDERPR